MEFMICIYDVKLKQGRNHHRLMQDAHEFFVRLVARCHEEHLGPCKLKGKTITDVEKHQVFLSDVVAYSARIVIVALLYCYRK